MTSDAAESSFVKQLASNGKIHLLQIKSYMTNTFRSPHSRQCGRKPQQLPAPPHELNVSGAAKIVERSILLHVDER